MTFAIICSCTNGICPMNCNRHCGKYWNTKTVHQAFTIKHVHISNHENHEVEIREDGQIILNHEQGLSGGEM